MNVCLQIERPRKFLEPSEWFLLRELFSYIYNFVSVNNQQNLIKFEVLRKDS